MVKIIKQGVYYMEGRLIKEAHAFMTSDKKEVAVKNTVAYGILSSHAKSMGETLALKPDAVFIYNKTDVLRTLDFVGMKEFPAPTYLFDGLFDGDFLRSAAKKWGGASVPGGLASGFASEDAYACEQVAASGGVLLCSDGVACGALGAMSFWGAEGDILRCLTETRWEEPRSETIAVFLKGKLRKGVGPTDVALSVMQALENAGNFAGGKILEVFGAGVSALSMDYRNAIDSALDCGQVSTVWMTDEKTKEYFENHLRAEAFKSLAPVQPAYYDGAVVVDLSDVEPMIDVNDEITTVREFLETAPEEYRKDGKVFLGATAIEYEAATYETMAEVAEILRGKQIGECACSWLPYSKSVTMALSEGGYLNALLGAGVDFNDLLDDREGLVGHVGQDANILREGTARLDARTIAATLANGGYLTSALGSEYSKRIKKYKFDPAPYQSRVMSYVGKPQKALPLVYGDEIVPLPKFPPLPETLKLSIDGGEGDLAVLIDDPEDYAWSYAVEDRERGAFAALAKSYPEKLRAHLIDWGILPLVYQKFGFKEGDVLLLDNIAELVKAGEERIVARVEGKRRSKDIVLTLGALTAEERKTLLAGGKNNLIRGK